MADLTELDLCVLGVIWRSGPLTAYRVRKEFQESTTVAWSSSAGSIYPSIRRLLAAGLALAGPPQDKRGAQALSVTHEGRSRLRCWVVELPSWLGSAMPDPIRTRSQFLTIAPPRDRLEFVRTARALTRRSLDLLYAEKEANAGDPAMALEQLGTIGAILELRARLDWLDQLLGMLPLES